MTKLRIITIIALCLTIPSTTYASLNSSWSEGCKDYQWSDVKDELQDEFPNLDFVYLNETTTNIFFVRQDNGKGYIQNINRKSGNVYEYDIHNSKWNYQGELKVTSCSK